MSTEQVLRGIDWSDESYHITDGVSVDLSSDTQPDKESIIRDAVRLFEERTNYNHYVYAFSFDSGRWYVGETEHLFNRFSTHIRERGIENIERIEGVPDRSTGRERERELSYELAIDKGSTEIYGGR